MKRLALALLVLTTVPLLAQNNRAAPPQLSCRVIDDFFQIPETIWMAEAVGVALNGKGHILILNRGNHPLLEFTPAGKFVRSLGEGSSPGASGASSSRFERQGPGDVRKAREAAGVVRFDPRARLSRREDAVSAQEFSYRFDKIVLE